MKNKESTALLWATDIHISDKTLELSRNIFAQIIEHSLKRKKCPIVLGGDIFNSRQSQPLSVLLVFKEFCNQCHDNGIDCYAIAGNHDKVDYRSKMSYLDLFNHSLLLFETYGHVMINGINCVFMPYFDENIYADFFKDVKVRENSYLFTHVAVNGVKNNDGTEVVNGVPVDFFKQFNRVFSGHYHNRQAFRNVVYTGSTHSAHFGEDNNKGIMLLHKDGHYDFIKLRVPEHVSLQVAMNESEKQFELLLQKVEDNQKSFRVIVEDDGRTDYSVRRRQLEIAGAKVELRRNDVVIAIENESEITQDLTDNQIMEEFDEWANMKKPANIDFGRQCLREA